MNNEIKYSVSELEDLDEIYNFHLKYLGEIRSKFIWDWEYGKLNPNGSLLLIAKKANRIIASQGVMFVPLNINNKNYKSGKNESLLIEQEYRKTGLFTSFYKFCFEEYNKTDIICLWGFTKKLGPFKHIGFSYNEIISRAVLPLSIGKTIKIGKINQMPFFKSIIYKIIISLSSAYSNLFFSAHSFVNPKTRYQVKVYEKMQNDNDLTLFFKRIKKYNKELIHIEFDKLYFNWRINKSPKEVFCYFAYIDDLLDGYIIIEKQSDFLEITDFLFHDKGTGHILIGKLDKMIKKLNSGFLLYSGNKYNLLNKNVFHFLRMYGFIRTKAPNGFVIKIFDNNLTDPLSNMRNWYITGIWSEGN